VEGDGEAAAREVSPILRRAELFIQHGDGRSALTILDALTTELLDQLEELDIDGEAMYRLLTDLGEDWTEAVLSADLTRAERQRWTDRLGEWFEALESAGLGEAFAMAATAADQEWDDPRVRRVLAGTIDAQGLWDGDPPSFADELALVRLRVLERQGRYKEYLHLAEAEGQVDRYLMMLIRLGRADQVVREAQGMLNSAEEARTVAEALRAADEVPGALTVAEYGLTLTPPIGPLATWLADAAEAAEQPALALRAAQAALRSEPSLTRLIKLKELAGASWPGLRATAIEEIRTLATRRPQDSEILDILIYERLVEDAISYGKGWADDRQTLGVMDAALPTRPEWVLKNATSQAQRIIEAGDAARYGQAIQLLERVRAGYTRLSREPEWQRLLSELRARHWRKHKLIALFELLEQADEGEL
jgi:uncharacterized Zn finger protein